MSSELAKRAATALQQASKELHGIVVSAGRMDKTVKVKLGGLRWEPRVQKFFKQPRFKLVHDPCNSVRQGDVVAITPTWRVSQHVRHVVKHIIAPYGDPIDERPAVPAVEERIAQVAAKRAAKDERRAVRKEEQTKIKEEEKAARQARRAMKLNWKAGQTKQIPTQDTTLDDVD
ncbi:nucleic acid-binding protein [Hypoxylon trugodes]|uniref:nucleic acid-binding protein n=1 Tax=Hypoxylon trugodes TaxID=326681 RepID=UPI0021960609|nr:nucleic acid-binding protein [Hypoxylon trugodes]KAI1385278.1 nucleic acid-binding protein [Hypoxylon trugodes]